MDIFSRIYYALAECCTGVKMKERRPQLEAVLDDLKRLNKDEFKFVIKQYLQLYSVPLQVDVEYCCSPLCQ